MATRSADAAFENYPLTIDTQGVKIRLRRISQDDRDAILAFGRSLPAHDLMYLRRDISKEAGIDRWLAGVKEGRIHTILAEDEEVIVGYSTIYQNELEWSQHVGEIRVTLAEGVRGTGLGRLMVREAFNIALALKIEKVLARMTLDQTGARHVFQELGFQNEALLKDVVKDREGKSHDLLIMAVDVESFVAQREAYGRA
ncbi:MAG: GNAT family N-acetyltransferase [Pseudomonadota bacterium]